MVYVVWTSRRCVWFGRTGGVCGFDDSVMYGVCANKPYMWFG